MKKTLLPDINVWLALTFDTHAQHLLARVWLASAANEPVAFCRVTQMGFLRLATNCAAFPHDARTLAEAWGLYDRIRTDQRVIFAQEPFGMEQVWRNLTQLSTRSPHVWADAYLAAFAQTADFEIVTFDKGFAQYEKLRCTILS
jgi:toxin-antitoxin system PIN domain toxin